MLIRCKALLAVIGRRRSQSTRQEALLATKWQCGTVVEAYPTRGHYRWMLQKVITNCSIHHRSVYIAVGAPESLLETFVKG